MNMHVTEPAARDHLRRSGYIVSPDMVADDHDEALVENVERCTACGGYGVIGCPECHGEGCNECGGTTEVYCTDCGGYDLLRNDLADAAIARVDARPENAAILCEQAITAAARRVQALASVPEHVGSDIDEFAAWKRAQHAEVTR